MGGASASRWRREEIAIDRSPPQHGRALPEWPGKPNLSRLFNYLV
jgi:hypothetical protein